MTTLNGVNPYMIANNLKSFKPTHPGEVLKDKLEYRGISQRELSKEIGAYPTPLSMKCLTASVRFIPNLR